MTGTLTFSVSAWPSHALVTMAGECDVTTAAQLLDTLTGPIAEHQRLIVVDLSGLRHLDLAGVCALIDARRVLTRRGRSLALACPRPIVSRMLELTQMGQLIPVYRNVAEALSADQRS